MFLISGSRSTTQQQVEINNQDQVRGEKMRLSFGFIVIAATVSLSLCYGYCATVMLSDSKTSKEMERDNSTSSKLLQAMTTDLQRISEPLKDTGSEANRNKSRLNGQDHLLVDSSDLLSILTSASDDGILETIPESQRPDSSNLLSLGLSNGLGHFDGSQLALASTTGQGWGQHSQYNMPRTYISKQQLVASTALRPKQQQLSSLDPYFQDQSSPRQNSYQKMPIINNRMEMARANMKPEQRKQRSFVSMEANQSPQEESDNLFEEKEPVREAVESDESVSKEFAEGDDIFKEDVQVPESGNNNKRRSLASAASSENDQEDDGLAGDEEEQEEEEQKSRLNPSSTSRSSNDIQYNQKQSRKPLRGIEDSLPMDGRSEASNIKAKKSNPEVELIMRLGSSKKQPASAASDSSEDEEISSESLIDKQTDLQAAAGHHHGHSHGHYYQYVEVPKKKAWKMGFKRGNHKHTIMRHEKGYKNKFHSSFKWNAKEKCKKKKKCHSTGKMTWHYEHHDKKKKHHY